MEYEEKSDLKWDVFISHASEDKDEVVRPLSESLTKRGFRVWYDEHTLKLGDSIRREIERGLAFSRFGIVVLSPSFIQKEWPNKELDFLVSVENPRSRRIFPIWHKLNVKDVQRNFPLLADRIAVSTSAGIDTITDRIVMAINGTPKKHYDESLEPATQQELYDHLVSSTIDNKYSLESIKILHAEDDMCQRIFLNEIFIEKGAIYDGVSDGAMALERLKKNSYDIVISDIMMPKLNGIELNLLIRESYPDIPVLFLTAFSSHEEQVSAGYILKPYSIEEIIDQIIDIVDNNGLYKISHSLFSDGDLTYRELFKCRRIIHRFLNNHKSNSFFETALRHKLKDVVRKFCNEIHYKIEGYLPAKKLRCSLSRFGTLMEQINHSSTNGIRKILQGIEEDILTERPGVTISVVAPSVYLYPYQVAI